MYINTNKEGTRNPLLCITKNCGDSLPDIAYTLPQICLAIDMALQTYIFFLRFQTFIVKNKSYCRFSYKSSINWASISKLQLCFNSSLYACNVMSQGLYLKNFRMPYSIDMRKCRWEMLCGYHYVFSENIKTKTAFNNDICQNI